MNSREVQLTTAFGLTVKYDGNNRGGKRRQRSRFSSNITVAKLSLLFLLEIILPSTYRNYVRGLCGNYDGITQNEYMKPDGTVVRNVNTFGESWRVTDRQTVGLRTIQVPHTVNRWDLNRTAAQIHLHFYRFFLFIFSPNSVSLPPDERWRLTQTLDLRRRTAPKLSLMTTMAPISVELCLKPQDCLWLVMRPCPLKPSRSEFTSCSDAM